MARKKTHLVSLTLAPAEKQGLAEYACAEDMSVSRAVRQIVCKALKSNKPLELMSPGRGRLARSEVQSVLLSEEEWKSVAEVARSRKESVAGLVRLLVLNWLLESPYGASVYFSLDDGRLVGFEKGDGEGCTTTPPPSKR